MEQTPLWTNDPEDQDIPTHIKARVEALLADPPFLAWMDQEDTRLLGLQAQLRAPLHP